MPATCGGLQDRRALRHGDRDIINQYIYHFFITTSFETAVAEVVAPQAAVGFLQRLLLGHSRTRSTSKSLFGALRRGAPSG